MTAAWEPIHGSGSPCEYERFTEWIAQRVSAGAAEPVEVDTPWAGASTVVERWFRRPDSGEVWRLVASDPPSRGLFERVAPARPHG
jgi:hypothetical protein